MSKKIVSEEIEVILKDCEISAENAYENTNLNSEIYDMNMVKIKDQHRSFQRYFTKEYIKDNDTFLDIGGAVGDLAQAIKTEVADIEVTVIDGDIKSIEAGRNKYKDFSFIHGFFPEALPSQKKYDIVSMQGLFAQLPNWKEILLALKEYSRKYINIEIGVKINGTTVIDKDVSYSYYLDSGIRVHSIMHNIYELTNFLCIHEMGVKKIEFYGYTTPHTGHNFRCTPNEEVIKGNIMIELFAEDEEYPYRMGGCSVKGEGRKDYTFFVPEMNIIINDEVFNLRK